MKTGFLITARLKSTRLPEKLMRDICGRPILAHMLDRVKLARRVDQIVICTSTHPQDDRLEALARQESVACFRGDEDDVVKRLADAAEAFQLDYLLNITADCPFVDPMYADRIVDAFEATRADWIRALELPHGVYSYGIRPAAFRTILDIKDDRNSEVWGRYFTDTDLFSIHDLPIENPFHRQPSLRMTLDYPEDLKFFEAVFAHLYQPARVFSLDEILQFLKAHPEVVEINRACALLYKKRWTRQSAIRLKPRRSVTRAAIVGCGSIGQRHIRNLRGIGVTDIFALRSRRGHFKQLDPALGLREVEEWDALIAAKPDVAIISNPTSLHLEAAARLIPHVRGILIEKPLAVSLDRARELLAQVQAHKVVSFIGYQLQFHAAVQAIQNLLHEERLGRALVLQCQVGQWLPDWHPYEDYRSGYYARQDLGGGVTLTLSHEIHLAQELLGPAREVSCFLSSSERLSLNVDVIADLMVRHESGAVSQIHLDYLQQPVHRCGVLSCERGWISYDLIRPQVTAQMEGESVPRLVWEEPSYDPNQPYIEQMRTFVRYVSEGRVRHEFDLWRGVQSLAIIEAAFVSMKSSRVCPVEH